MKPVTHQAHSCLIGLSLLGAFPQNPDATSKPEDFDPYFHDTSVVSSETGPRVITRNVLQDRQGMFWLATWNGIVRYDGSTFTNVTNKEGLRRYRAFSLLEDRAGNLWFGTVGAGAYRYDGTTYTHFTTKDGLVDDTVLSIFQDRDGNLWFGAMGVTKYDGTTFTSFTAEDGFTSSDVHSIFQGPDGTLWFGTRGALFRYDGESFVNFTQELGLNLESNSYVPALIDRKGHLWFSGSSGIYHHDGDSLRHLFKPASFCLMEDSRGNIWFNSGPPGDQPTSHTSILNRFPPTADLDNLLPASQQFEVQSPAIFGITEDKNGNLWFGTSTGVAQVEEDRVRYF